MCKISLASGLNRSLRNFVSFLPASSLEQNVLTDVERFQTDSVRRQPLRCVPDTNQYSAASARGFCFRDLMCSCLSNILLPFPCEWRTIAEQHVTSRSLLRCFLHHIMVPCRFDAVTHPFPQAVHVRNYIIIHSNP